MIIYYARDGSPLDLMAWAELLEDPAQRIVRQSWCRGWKVSTVWLGIDMSFSFDPDSSAPHVPLIFETMIFAAENGHPLDLWQARTPTEETALDAHWEAVGLVTAETGAFLEDVTGTYTPVTAEVAPTRTREAWEMSPDAMRWVPGKDDDQSCATSVTLTESHLATRPRRSTTCGSSRTAGPATPAQS